MVKNPVSVFSSMVTTVIGARCVHTHYHHLEEPELFVYSNTSKLQSGVWVWFQSYKEVVQKT